jgi:hypothetical protein
VGVTQQCRHNTSHQVATSHSHQHTATAWPALGLSFQHTQQGALCQFCCCGETSVQHAKLGTGRHTTTSQRSSSDVQQSVGGLQGLTTAQLPKPLKAVAHDKQSWWGDHSCRHRQADTRTHAQGTTRQC